MTRTLLAFLFTLALHAQTLRLHPANPRYYEFRGKPTVLVTSAEHYGAVLNLDFDQTKYLDTLAKDKLNLSRIFSGAYREFAEDFGISRNTLAPAPGRYITPWVEVSPNKWDLTKWNPAYFERLRNFVRMAAGRGIVVEMTLFTAYYDAKKWEACPLFKANNVNGVGDAVFTEALTLKHKDLVEAQSAMVRKIVTELNAFDNVLFEICNEPYFAGVTLDWQRHIARVIDDTEDALPRKHLIAQNIANNTAVVAEPDPLVSVFNFHYARPPVAVEQNWHLNRVIGFDESGFDGTLDAVYRIQGWDFILAGGAHYNNLDYSFAVGHEDGTFKVPGTDPGFGSPNLRRSLRVLQEFISSFDFIRMSPARDLIVAGVPEGASARALAEPGKQYAIYIHHGRVQPGLRPAYAYSTRRQLLQLELRLPKGTYNVEWWNPRTGSIDHRDQAAHEGGPRRISSPPYTEDIALRLTAP
jgi:hypothetical protein